MRQGSNELAIGAAKLSGRALYSYKGGRVEGKVREDELYCSHKTSGATITKRVTRTWFSLILGKALKGAVPDDVFKEFGYIPTLLRLSPSDMGEMNGCNFMCHNFFEGKGEITIEDVREKIVVAALGKKEVKDRTLFIQNAEQLDSLKCLLVTAEKGNTLGRHYEIGLSAGRELVVTLRFSSMENTNLSTRQTAIHEQSHNPSESSEKENRSNAFSSTELPPYGNSKPRKTVQQKSLMELTSTTNVGQSAGTTQECQQS